MPAQARNTWQQPEPLPLFPLLKSYDAAGIAALTPASGMLIYNSDTNKLQFYAAAGWETITSV